MDNQLLPLSSAGDHLIVCTAVECTCHPEPAQTCTLEFCTFLTALSTALHSTFCWSSLPTAGSTVKGGAMRIRFLIYRGRCHPLLGEALPAMWFPLLFLPDWGTVESNAGIRVRLWWASVSRLGSHYRTEWGFVFLSSTLAAGHCSSRGFPPLPLPIVQ